MKLLFKFFSLACAMIAAGIPAAHSQQKDPVDTASQYKTVAAGPEYKRSRWHKFLWGKNYRKEWTKPVRLPVFMIKTTNGGFEVSGEGGGHQTTSLHLVNADGKNYTLRSVNKKLGKVLPDNFRGTFIEHLANDEVSMSHPFSAVTVPDLAQSVGVYHTTPQYVYLPRQAALDSLNDKVGNAVYLFEQRLKGDWSSSNNLGNFEKYYDTSDVIKKILSDPDHQVDEAAFARARLFDMLLGDWDRHGDQWRWGMVKKGDKKIFIPVPEDRDQVYFKHNGVLLDAVIYGSGIRYFQSFKDHISRVTSMNYEERWLDRFFINQLTRSDWENIAQSMQQSLTDNVIETAVKKLPPEIFAISGNHIISDLKSRRNHLVEYATKYYLFISKEVQVPGSEGSDYFLVNRINDSATVVKVFNITKKGVKEDIPYYSRTFLASETKEVRLFGISGKDIFTTGGGDGNAIKIRIISGADRDSITVNSGTGNHSKTFVYHGPDDYLQTEGKVKSYSYSYTDSASHAFNYRDYTYDSRGTNAALFYSLDDRIFVGLGYGWKHQKWRRSPFAFKQGVSVHYSITQRAASVTYAGIFPNTIGKWNLELLGNYDFIRWTNFYGLGNETPLTTTNKDFNRMRSHQALGKIELNRKAGHNLFEIHGFLQTIKIINDDNRYVANFVHPVDSGVFNVKSFAGGAAGYTFSQLNDAIVPTAGIALSGNLSYTQSLQHSSQSFWKYGGTLQLYVPLVSKFSLAISGGIESVDGSPEFYQYPYIGGGPDLRGFQLQRFYGKTAYYNSNELRFISKIKSYFFNGKAGLLAFFDDGRVWMPLETSNTIHTGYGGGIVVAPFNLMFLDITYGISNEQKLIQLRLNVKL
jgi:Omp85 superfamily domain